MKSLAMLNLNRISPKTDFCSEIEAIDTRLLILNKNVLYVTHQTDKILKILNKVIVDKSLQSQVDEFFEKDETSPQTDLDEQ